MGEARGGLGFASVIDGVKDLVANQLDAMLGGELVQSLHLGVADGGAGRVMRAVYQDQLGLRIGETLDLVHIDAEAVFPAQAEAAQLEAERLGKRREVRQAGQRHDDVGSGLGGKPHEHEEGFGGARDHLDVVDTDALHLGDRLAQTVGARGTAESHFVIQVTLARGFAAEVEEFVGSPSGAGASGEIEFDAVFVGVEPSIEQKGLQAHEVTSEQIDAPVKARQIRVWLDSSLGMRLAGAPLLAFESGLRTTITWRVATARATSQKA